MCLLSISQQSHFLTLHSTLEGGSETLNMYMFNHVCLTLSSDVYIYMGGLQV